MYDTKRITEGCAHRLLSQCRWLIENTVRFGELVICERAELVAPEGKFLTMTANGVVRDIRPGVYDDVVITVSEGYRMGPHGLMNVNQISRWFNAAVCVEDGKLVPEKSVSAAVWGGEVTDAAAKGLYLACAADGFNGILVAGDSEYTVDGVRMDMEGFGDNDFIGAGAAVTVVDKGRVNIRNSKFTLSGVTRCAVHVGGDSEVRVSDCEIVNISPASDWLGSFSWAIALRGTNRLCQLSDNGTVTYDHCRLKSNGWALCSVDGTDERARMLIKDSLLELSGPRSHGYGAFCIGEDIELTIDHSVVDVYGYPLLVMGMGGGGRPSIVNGSVIRGRRFGAMLVSDDNSVLTVRGSHLQTEKSCFVVKGSASAIVVEKSTLEAGNGVILQMMDTDECGMDKSKFFVPVGEKDVPVEGRDLSAFDAGRDVDMTLSGMELNGSFFNSTTNIRAESRALRDGMGRFHDTLVGEVSFNGPRGEDADLPPMKDLNGPKNLRVTLKKTKLKGAVSSATQAYREGLTEITPDTCLELSNVTQTAAPTVNNGVLVSLDEGSLWVVTENCWITALTLAPGAGLRACEGKHLAVTVDGEPLRPGPGSWTGKIVLTVN